MSSLGDRLSAARKAAETDEIDFDDEPFGPRELAEALKSEETVVDPEPATTSFAPRHAGPTADLGERHPVAPFGHESGGGFEHRPVSVGVGRPEPLAHRTCPSAGGRRSRLGKSPPFGRFRVAMIYIVSRYMQLRN